MAMFGKKSLPPIMRHKDGMKRRKTRIGRPRIMRLRPAVPTEPANIVPAVDAPVSLPLSERPDEPLAVPTFVAPEGLATVRKIPPPGMARNSQMRDTVNKILLMRVAGHEDAEIAEALGIKKTTLSTYVYYAGVNGWLNPEVMANPADRVEYALLHKVVRNLEQSLDSTNPIERQEVTLEMAKGTLFKKWGSEVSAALPSSTVVAIKIEMPPGASSMPTEEIFSGVGSYTDGEVE